MFIRKATADDWDTIKHLLVELRSCGYAEMGLPPSPITVLPESRRNYLNALKRHDIHIFLAEEKDSAVGLAVVYEIVKILDGKPRFLIEELVISPDARGKGAGTAMMKYIEGLAVSRGVTVIKVTTGTKLRANDFYRKLGYTHFENAYRKKV